jgi:predicted nucleic acid-binding protein
VVIVDTTVWIDYFRDVSNAEVRWLEAELERQRLGMIDIILCEVLQGVPDERTFDSVFAELSRCEIFPTGGTEFAVAAARNFRILRQRGHTVRRTIDCLIATFCIREGHSLLHRDRDFDLFEKSLGLSVIHP